MLFDNTAPGMRFAENGLEDYKSSVPNVSGGMDLKNQKLIRKDRLSSVSF